MAGGGEGDPDYASDDPPPPPPPTQRDRKEQQQRMVPQVGAAGTADAALPRSAAPVVPRSPPRRAAAAAAASRHAHAGFALTPEPGDTDPEAFYSAAMQHPQRAQTPDLPQTYNSPGRNPLIAASCSRELWLREKEERTERLNREQQRLRVGPLGGSSRSTPAEGERSEFPAPKPLPQRIRATGKVVLPMYQTTGRSRRWPNAEAAARQREVSIPLQRVLHSSVDKRPPTATGSTTPGRAAGGGGGIGSGGGEPRRRCQVAAEQCRKLFGTPSPDSGGLWRAAAPSTAAPSDNLAPVLPQGIFRERKIPRSTQDADKDRIAVAMTELRRRRLMERLFGEELLRRECVAAQQRREARIARIPCSFRSCEGLRTGSTKVPGLPGLLRSPAHRPEPAQPPAAASSPESPQGGAPLLIADRGPVSSPEQQAKQQQWQVALAEAHTAGRGRPAKSPAPPQWSRQDFEYPPPVRSTEPEGSPRHQGQAPPRRSPRALVSHGSQRALLFRAGQPTAPPPAPAPDDTQDREELWPDMLAEAPAAAAAAAAAAVVLTRTASALGRVPLRFRPCSPTQVNDRKWHLESTILRRMLDKADLGAADADSRRGLSLLRMMDENVIPRRWHSAIRKRAPFAEEGYTVLRGAVEQGSEVPSEFHSYQEFADPGAHITANEAAAQMALPPSYRDPLPRDAKAPGATDVCYGGLFTRKEMHLLGGLLAPRRDVPPPSPELSASPRALPSQESKDAGRRWRSSRCPATQKGAIPSLALAPNGRPRSPPRRSPNLTPAA
eukprot:TRINITY_DN982_c5_g1_i1.p1 TRINITY_DN982_c5_g1~~TRINITY_DN982_c5_g1_i1.p1  ORF type:complete len:804 (+),score=163.80 TRINITY_DN982_c5_g1_i1:73-2412(+)